MGVKNYKSKSLSTSQSFLQVTNTCVKLGEKKASKFSVLKRIYKFIDNIFFEITYCHALSIERVLLRFSTL